MKGTVEFGRVAAAPVNTLRQQTLAVKRFLFASKGLNESDDSLCTPELLLPETGDA